MLIKAAGPAAEPAARIPIGANMSDPNLGQQVMLSTRQPSWVTGKG